MTFEDRVIRHRAEIMRSWVSKTEDQIRSFEHELQTIRPRGEFYIQMQQRILTSPSAMQAWQTFMLTVQLVVTDKIPGITSY